MTEKSGLAERCPSANRDRSPQIWNLDQCGEGILGQGPSGDPIGPFSQHLVLPVLDGIPTCNQEAGLWMEATGLCNRLVRTGFIAADPYSVDRAVRLEGECHIGKCAIQVLEQGMGKSLIRPLGLDEAFQPGMRGLRGPPTWRGEFHGSTEMGMGMGFHGKGRGLGSGRGDPYR